MKCKVIHTFKALVIATMFVAGSVSVVSVVSADTDIIPLYSAGTVIRSEVRFELSDGTALNNVLDGNALSSANINESVGFIDSTGAVAGAVEITSSFSATDLIISTGDVQADSMTITTKNTINITGSADKGFVSVSGANGNNALQASKVNFVIDAEGADLTLGKAESSNSGTIGSVTLNSDLISGTIPNVSTLNTLGTGTINIGDIIAKEDSKGNLIASAAITNTGSIGTNTVNVNSVEANGTLNVKGNVYASALTVNGVMTVQAGADFGSTGSVTIGSGDNISFASNASLTVADTLRISNNGFSIGQEATKSGSALIKKEASTNISVNTKNLTVDGVDISINIIQNSSLNVSSELTTTYAQAMNIGSSDDKGKGSVGALSVSILDSVGSTIFASSAYVADAEQAKSAVAIGRFKVSSNTIDVNLVAGQLSQIAVGQVAGVTVSHEYISESMKKANLTWASSENNATNAVFGITQAMMIAPAGSITVNGALTSTSTSTSNLAGAGNALFANNSLFIVDVNGLRTADGKVGDNAALKGKDITADAGAHLLLSNVKADDKINIATAAGNLSIANGAWGNNDTDTKTIHFDNIFIGGTLDTSTVAGTAIVNISQNAASNIFPNLDNSLAGLVDTAITAGIISADSYSYGGRFLYHASNLVATNGANTATVTIEGATKLSVVAGVIPSLTAVSSAGLSNIEVRTGLGNMYVANSTAINFDGDTIQISQVSGSETTLDESANTANMESGLGLWVMPMYQSLSANGFESGNFDYGYDTDFYGVSIGFDSTTMDNFRLGAAFHIGAGSSDSTGDLIKTTNDFDYYGFSIYSAYRYNNLAISADLGYTISDNEIAQDSPVGKLTAIPSSQVVTAGLKAEYIFSTAYLDIIPHVGIRVNHVTVDGYNTNYMGGVAFYTSNVEATTLQFPLGISIVENIVISNGWVIRPSTDLGVLFTTGDTDIKQNIRIPGVNSSANMNSTVADIVTLQGGLGFNLSKNSFSIALDYKLNVSEHVTSHGIFGTVRYEF